MSAAPPPGLNRLALDPTRSVVVAACAGSGKTWLLVARIVRLLLAGVPPGEILAITFTRKAAQEMAARLRAWLELLAGAEDAQVRKFLRELEVPEFEFDAALAAARALYERVLTAQPEITIATFHSWFLQLLRAAPLEAGALGNVTLTDRASNLIAEAWERFASACQRAPQAPPALGLALLFREFGLHNTRTLLAGFVQRRAEWWVFAGNDDQAVARALAVQAAALTVAVDADVPREFLADADFAAEVLAFARLLCDNGARERPLGEAVLAAFADPPAAFAALRAAVFRQDGDPRARRATNALRKARGAAVADELARLHGLMLERVQAALDALADLASYRANAAGLAAGVALLDHYQAVKRDRQVIDFADVEWLAHELLLRGERAIAMQFKLDARYRHVLLDEFQDTNALQWLALKAWFEAAVQAGSAPIVFLVGDPKQAIYRFRRAEPRLFDAARTWLTRHHGASDLSQDESRRSAQPLLDVVNRLFAAETLYAAAFREHRAHFGDLPGRVEVLPLARNPERAVRVDTNAMLALRDPLVEPAVVAEDERREREAAMLVERLQQIVSQWVVIEDARSGTSRRAAYGDVMLLVRRRTHLEIYEHALRHAGIPFVTSRQGGLLDTLEVADLLALLEFLVAPFEDLKLAHALRSPLFGCTDADLAQLAQGVGESWWARLVALTAAGASPALRRAHALLSAWLERADMLPVHDQLDRIYFEADVVRRYAHAVPPALRAAVAANLDAFMHRALALDAGRYPSLPRFIGEMRELQRATSEEAPDEGAVDSAGDAVRILTVHGAKGLEAPIVWLLDTAAGPPIERGYGVLVDWPPDAAAPRSFSLAPRLSQRSTAQSRHAAAEAEHAAREDLNLLYVAMTRARQALIVSGCEGKGDACSWYAKLRAALMAAAGLDAADAAAAIAYGDDLAAAWDGAGASVADEALTNDPALDRPLPTGRRVPVLGGPGLRYGTAFHAVMEALTGARAVQAEAVRARLGLTTGVFAPLWAQATRLVALPELAQFFDPAQYLRAYNEASLVTAQGELRRVDRVVEFDDTVWVLDYKTGSRDDAAAISLQAAYRAQLEGYRAALQQVYVGKLLRAALIFADGSRIDV